MTEPRIMRIGSSDLPEEDVKRMHAVQEFVGGVMEITINTMLEEIKKVLKIEHVLIVLAADDGRVASVAGTEPMSPEKAEQILEKARMLMVRGQAQESNKQ